MVMVEPKLEKPDGNRIGKTVKILKVKVYCPSCIRTVYSVYKINLAPIIERGNGKNTCSRILVDL